MGCGTGCLKCLLIACNITLAVIGLVILAGGIFLKVFSQKYIDEYAKEFNAQMAAQQSSSDSNDTTTGPTTSRVDLTELVDPFAFALIAFGSVVAIIALVGAFGVCCDSRTLLSINSFVVILLIIVEIVLTILFFVKAFDTEIRHKIKYTLKEHYIDDYDVSTYSLTWNFVMQKHECCGLDGYEDFKQAKKWQRNRTVSGSGDYVNLETPIACCKRTALEKSANDTLSCASKPSDETSNWKTGCWEKITKSLAPYETMVIGIISAVIFAQALLAFITILIAWRLHKTKNYF